MGKIKLLVVLSALTLCFTACSKGGEDKNDVDKSNCPLVNMGITNPVKSIVGGKDSENEKIYLTYTNNYVSVINLEGKYSGSCTYTNNKISLYESNSDESNYSYTADVSDIQTNESGYVTHCIYTYEEKSDNYDDKERDTCNFKYDSSGHIIEATTDWCDNYNDSESKGNYTSTFKWTNGDLTEAEYNNFYDGNSKNDECYTYYYNYSSNSFDDTGVFYYMYMEDGFDFNEMMPLIYSGMLGCRGTHIPTSYTRKYSNGTGTDVYTYSISCSLNSNNQIASITEINKTYNSDSYTTTFGY